MAVGLTTALVMGGLAAAGSIGGAAVSAHAAGSAADKQANAADQIRELALSQADKASGTVNAATDTANQDLATGESRGNDVISQATDAQLAALKPYIDSGQVSLSDLQTLLGPGGPLADPNAQFKFTSKDYANDPGYDFIRQQANTALERSAAARGSLFTGGTVRASDRLNTGLASTHLDEAFNRALATYQTNRQNLTQRIQGLTGITNLGFSATGVQNQDIGNSAQLLNSNIQNTARLTAAQRIAAGQYSGNVGLHAADTAANAIGAKAGAQGAADINTASAINSGINGLLGAANLVYSLPRTSGGSTPTGNTLVPLSYPFAGKP